MEVIQLAEKQKEPILYEDDNFSRGRFEDDESLYLVDREKQIAYRLPDKYKDTPCYEGGYQDGLIKVSLMGEIPLSYYRIFGEHGGLWGWIDMQGEEVIKPQYAYASDFENGIAIVCQADSWYEDERGRYWCDHEKWGAINRKGEEVISCQYDELRFMDNIFYDEDGTKYLLAHAGGWENGTDYILNASGEVFLELDFELERNWTYPYHFYYEEFIILETLDFSIEDEDIVEYEENGEQFCNNERIYIYDIKNREWIAYYDNYKLRESGDKKQIIRLRNGEEKFMLEMPEEYLR